MTSDEEEKVSIFSKENPWIFSKISWRRLRAKPAEAREQVNAATPPQVSDKQPVPAEIYNIGCGSPMQLMDFISTLEQALGHKAQMNMLPMQKGDVYTTYADTTKLERDFGYRPQVTLADGIARFAEWYTNFKDNFNL